MGAAPTEPPKLYPYHLLVITNYRLPADVDRCNLEVGDNCHRCKSLSNQLIIKNIYTNISILFFIIIFIEINVILITIIIITEITLSFLFSLFSDISPMQSSRPSSSVLARNSTECHSGVAMKSKDVFGCFKSFYTFYLLYIRIVSRLCCTVVQTVHSYCVGRCIAKRKKYNVFDDHCKQSAGWRMLAK